MKLIKWIKSFFLRSFESVIKHYEPELRQHITEVLSGYWNSANLTTISDAIVEGVCRILPKRYRQYVDMILDQFVANTLEDVDFDGDIKSAEDAIYSKLRSIK